MHHIVGLDIGYGFTKAVSGQRRTTERSLVGPAVTIKYHNELSSNGHGLRLEADGKRWFLGELARRQSPFTISPRARERDSQLIHTLTRGALYRLGITDGTVHLITGLPVAWYPDREHLIEMLMGNHRYTVQGTPCEVEIADVRVVPQPFGSYFRVLLSPKGQFTDTDRLARERVAILDIGTHTTDYALADTFDYVEPRSGSIPVAMARVYELVQRAVAERFSLELSLADAEQATRNGTVTVYGERESLHDVVPGAVDAVAQQILAEATTLWGDGRDLAAVLVTGGGGRALLGQIQARYPHARLVPEPQLANAKGFYRYALRKFRAVAAGV
jgi:plasmid segregation protein ParM